MSRNSRESAPRKTLQLCRQVERVLSQILSGELDDDVLLGVQVVAVEPAPDDAQLCVTVAPWAPGETIEPREVLARLYDHAPRLRQEVAAAISRRRAPSLVFRALRGSPMPDLRTPESRNGDSEPGDETPADETPE